MPDFGATELLIGGQVLGGLMGADAAKSAGDTQAASADRASANQMAMYNKTEQNLAPWMQTGSTALKDLGYFAGINGPSGDYNGDPRDFGKFMRSFSMDDFQESPAYQFNLEQGRKAIDKSASARGKYYAPSTLQDIAKFSQGLASNEFQNSYNNYNNNLKTIWDRLYTLSGSGQNAAAQTGAFGSNASNAIGNNITSAGAAQAAGGVGAANAVSGGINGAYNGYMTNQILQGLQAPAYRPQVQASIPGQFNLDSYG